jgi:hypothetical protein
MGFLLFNRSIFPPPIPAYCKVPSQQRTLQPGLDTEDPYMYSDSNWTGCGGCILGQSSSILPRPRTQEHHNPPLDKIEPNRLEFVRDPFPVCLAVVLAPSSSFKSENNESRGKGRIKKGGGRGVQSSCSPSLWFSVFVPAPAPIDILQPPPVPVPMPMLMLMIMPSTMLR